MRAEQGSFLPNRHFFTAIQSLKRPAAQVAVAFTRPDEHKILARFKTDGYAYFIHLISPEAQALYGDNCFDLEPGTEREIEIDLHGAALQEKQIQCHWR